MTSKGFPEFIQISDLVWCYKDVNKTKRISVMAVLFKYYCSEVFLIALFCFTQIVLFNKYKYIELYGVTLFSKY